MGFNRKVNNQTCQYYGSPTSLTDQFDGELIATAESTDCCWTETIVHLAVGHSPAAIETIQKVNNQLRASIDS